VVVQPPGVRRWLYSELGLWVGVVRCWRMFVCLFVCLGKTRKSILHCFSSLCPRCAPGGPTGPGNLRGPCGPQNGPKNGPRSKIVLNHFSSWLGRRMGPAVVRRIQLKKKHPQKKKSRTGFTTTKKVQMSWRFQTSDQGT